MEGNKKDSGIPSREEIEETLGKKSKNMKGKSVSSELKREINSNAKKVDENIKRVAKDTIDIPVGRWMSKARENPWFVTTIVLALILIGFLIFGRGTAGAASQSSVSQDVLAFLNSQVEGEVVLDSITNKGSYYELTVSYQGQSIPIYATLDGKNIITDLVPLSGSVDDGNGNTGGVVDVEIPEDAYVRGDADAPVTIVEFSDFECPFCEVFYSQSLGLIEQNYIDTGKAKIVYMHYPLGFHTNAQKAAEASECAGEQGKFWEMHDQLFENQASLSVENYKLWAKQLGLNSGKFDSCLDSGKYAIKVEEQTNYGSQIGVSGTPGFFIGSDENGYVVVSGAQPYNVFQQAIEAELNR